MNLIAKVTVFAPGMGDCRPALVVEEQKKPGHILSLWELPSGI